MKKYLIALAILFAFSGTILAQLNLNVSLVGQKQYTENANDIWGYVDSSGNEYALVGLRNGVSVVDLSTPSNPVEVAYLPGAASTWRDIKTWGRFAYVTTDQGSDGLMVIDLSLLPATATATLWQPTLTLPNGSGTLERAHNIYIDNGYAYLSGHNISNRGVMILDVQTSPGTPIYVGAADDTYSHDNYVRNDTLYSADISAGYFSVYDVTTKTAPALLATQNTPSNFTHNVWLSDDSKSIFTTDEVANGYVGSYDISDLGNIEEIDRFQPRITQNQGVIPHNVQVWNDYIIISYYTDGCIVVDAARPDNLIEVGNFDTFIGGNGGFSGAWGAYPFLPSGLILVSDIGNGLYVLQPNYVRACYLEGTVSDSLSMQPLTNASVKILTTLEEDDTDNNGVYKTGIATAGTYDIEISAPGYTTKTIQTTLSNGVLTLLDVELVPLNAFVFQGMVQDVNGNPIENAIVDIINNDFNYTALTDASGSYSFNTFFSGDYKVAAGKWGYKTKIINQNFNNAPSGGYNITLEAGIEDIFDLDLGWTTVGTATTGHWERGEPIGVTYQNAFTQPDNDILLDDGDHCYVTGNSGGQAGDNDIDGGFTRLTSPHFDLTGYTAPVLKYSAWFYNGGGNSNPNDYLEVRITNGVQTVTIETITQSNSAWRPEAVVRIDSFITPTANMQIIFISEDQNPGHLVEAAVDFVQVLDTATSTVNTTPIFDNKVSLSAFPNPSSSQFTIDFGMEQVNTQASIRIVDMLGRELDNSILNTTRGQIQVGNNLSAGVYIVQLVVDGQPMKSIKVVKK